MKDETSELKSSAFQRSVALAQLRHLYMQMVNGYVRDTAQAKRIAVGLLGPAIERLEQQ